MRVGSNAKRKKQNKREKEKKKRARERKIHGLSGYGKRILKIYIVGARVVCE